MSKTQIIEDIENWLNQSVLPNIKLKKPLSAQDYKMEEPKAYSMYLPNKEMIDSFYDYPYPSVLVQFKNSTDYLKAHTGEVDILLHIAVWNPGKHRPEMGKQEAASPGLKYLRSADGWKDTTIVAEIIENQLLTEGSINGHRILFEKGIRTYPYAEENAIIDFYPFFFMEMEFSIENAFATTPKPYQKYL